MPLQRERKRKSYIVVMVQVIVHCYTVRQPDLGYIIIHVLSLVNEELRERAGVCDNAVSIVLGTPILETL